MNCWCPWKIAPFRWLMNGAEIRGERGWVLNNCILLHESLKPAIYMKSDPTNKTVHPFTFRFFPFMVSNGILQAHVRPLDGAILENNCMLASTNTHLAMGFEIPQGFTVWIGNPRDIAVLDGALLNCYVMFKLVEGWTHMKVVKFYSVRKNGKFDYQTKHVGTVYVQDIFFNPRKYGHGADAPLSTWCLLRSLPSV